MTGGSETDDALRATLHERVEAEALVSTISRRLLALPAVEVDTAITDSLGRVGRFVGADAVALLQISDEGPELQPTHIWLEHGGEPPPPSGSAGMGRLMSVVAHRHEHEQHQFVRRVDELVDGSDRRVLLSQGARSVAWVPVRGNGTTVGSLDLIWRDREAEDVCVALEALRVLGDVFLVALERKQAEEALRASEHRFRAIVDATSDMIAVLEPDGAIRYVSPVIEHVLGWRAEQKVGTNAFDDVHPDDRCRVWEHFTNAIAADSGRAGSPTAFRLRHRDGSWRQVEAVASNLTHDPAVRGIVVNTRDVGERTRLEEELLQSHKMEAVGRLAGGVAHDFNNLLTAIAGYTALALEGLEPGHAVERDLIEIDHAATRAADLVDQLLAFSRRKVIRPTVLDLNDVVRSMDPILERLICPNVRFETRLTNTTTGVRADRTQLEQIIINLVVNAVDAFGDTGGRVMLSTGSAHIAPQTAGAAGVSPGQYLVLRVADDGQGMNGATHARVFEPFFTTKEPGRGTGLGLSTVYGIATQAGGHVSITSRPGRGTTVRVYLPAVTTVATPVATEPFAPFTVPGGNETVLIAEDELAVRSLARSVLRRLGYTVLCAANGDEALGVAQNHTGPIHLLVADVVLTSVGEESVASRFTSSHPHVPVLLISECEPDIPDPALDKRVDYLAKPFRPYELARRIREMLDAGTSVA
ncbi:MAG TPA: ATP-binding protein [Acidimicrobiia bacterium]